MMMIDKQRQTRLYISTEEIEVASNIEHVNSQQHIVALTTKLLKRKANNKQIGKKMIMNNPPSLLNTSYSVTVYEKLCE